MKINNHYDSLDFILYAISIKIMKKSMNKKLSYKQDET